MNPRLQIRAAVLAALLGLATSSAHADDAALAKEVESLRAALAEQRAQLEAQAKLLEAQQAQLDALTHKLAAGAPPAAATVDAPKVALTNARPTITTADGHASFAVRANVQMDGAAYQEHAEGAPDVDFRRGSVGGAGNRETNAARDFSDGFYFRRARVGIEGTFARDFSYRLLVELGGAGSEGPTRINDSWIAYSGLAPFTFQVGAFAPAANMDDGTSTEDLPLIERASASELSRSLGGADGRFGLAIKAGGKRWMSSLAFTTRTVNDPEVFDSAFNTVARVGVLAATGEDFNLHVGASGTYVFSPADLGSSASPPRHAIRFRERPELRVDGTRLIDTGSLDAAHASVVGFELGATWKNFYLQGEHFWFDVARREPTALDDPRFAGYYLQGSWIVTGERRRYNPVSGSFQGPRPKAPFAPGGGWGAWELAARYSRMDLNFQPGLEGTAAVPGSVRGGDQSVITLGLNWYLNPNFKLMLDYLMIDVDRLNPAGPGNAVPFGPAPLTPPTGVEIGQDLDVVALRTQYSF